MSNSKLVQVPEGCRAVFVAEEIVEALSEWTEPMMLQMKIRPEEGDVAELWFKRIYDWNGLVRAYKEVVS